jgi:phenylacetate-CoA ligase
MSYLFKAFKLCPIQVQDLAVTLVNTKSYITRRSGVYKYYRDYYARWENATKDELNFEANRRLQVFIEYAAKNSKWYSSLIKVNITNSECLASIPILEKKDIVQNLSQMTTISRKKGIINKTGGTTGTSMQTVYKKSDIQERFAVLDNFRSQHGYELGERTAWFSGKNIITEEDISKGICSHYDFINKIRFYSTFHINTDNFNVYWASLNKFKPKFIVGFPSSVYEICKIADEQGLKLHYKAQVYFPNAETLLPNYREVISRVLGCRIIDQYSSSEGAPFIFECAERSLHIHPLTGIFEVVDESMQPASEGEVLVTFFTTEGTPLIRYRIGDRLITDTSGEDCTCGSQFPRVNKIEGRSNDYIYSIDKGRVNSNLITVFTKDIPGLICLQLIQNSLNQLNINIVSNSQKYTTSSEKKLISSLRDLVGSQIEINIAYVEEIPREKSGKFRMVKNNLDFSVSNKIDFAKNI